MFGINRFNDITEAFKSIEGEYGECSQGFEDMAILTDYEFQRVVFNRLATLIVKNNIEGDEHTKWLFDYAVPTESNEDIFTDYFIDFNFFLKSDRNGCYYTCLMSFKDDRVTKFNNKQLEWMAELMEDYNFPTLWEIAYNMFADVDDYDEMNNILIENELMPFQATSEHYTALEEQFMME